MSPIHRLFHQRARMAVLAVATALAFTNISPLTAQQVTTSTVVSTDTETADPTTEPTSPRQYFETVTVSTTLSPATTREVPGTVSVIDSDTIERRLIQNTADLVKFEPGVYVEANVTRIGLNGFNIRGIGGNRVLTQVDGVETSEQFDFGPFNVHQFTLDLDTLRSAEIMRSSGSAVYGSDALGGVVSFFTKDPADYLQGRRFHASGKAGYDSRAREASANAAIAGGSRRLLGSLFLSVANGDEPRNRGTVRTENAARTALNPQDRQSAQVLAKVAIPFSPGNVARAIVEIADTNVFTSAYSLRVSPVADITSDDTMTRRRFSFDQAIVGVGALTQLSWSGYVQQSQTDQVVDEVRAASGSTPPVFRSGTLGYSQDSYGGTIQGRQVFTAGERSMLVTAGLAHKHHTFDMLRDRLDIHQITGAVVPATGGLILPSKYFPKSEVGETGGYMQAEVRVPRLLLLPGLRFDRFTLDADQSDQVFLATLSPAPANFSADAVSGRFGASLQASQLVTIHGQWAEGFRAPPYSAVNSGFTNLLGGYTSIPNTSLSPETSQNLEAGVRAGGRRGSLGVTTFVNRYRDFIDQVLRGTNPTTRLLEYQYQNLARVNIRGVELQGQARISNTMTVRGSYAAIRGRNRSGDTDIALNSIAPNQGAVGLAYVPIGNRWGSEFSVRAAAAQSQETAGDGLFAPSAFAVADLTGWFVPVRTLTVRAGVLNLTNTKYFEWTNVRGRQSTDAALDRYTSPGISGVLSVSYGW